jgi:hypothetical protein
MRTAVVAMLLAPDVQQRVVCQQTAAFAAAGAPSAALGPVSHQEQGFAADDGVHEPVLWLGLGRRTRIDAMPLAGPVLSNYWVPEHLVHRT